MGKPNTSYFVAQTAECHSIELSLTSYILGRITNIPSQITFEISQFPNNVPLPSPVNSARVIGGTMHFLHLCVRVAQIRRIPDSDLGWEDMYRENEGVSWFDWVRRLSSSQ